ncbi:hypothetical protein AB1Y20_015088 [Prymnesium parvum]|uniref:Membrane transporter protein n=1 Tax=Prymnesium parvum TaxID=97485 RepID=A0AB34K0C4_PRYPA
MVPSPPWHTTYRLIFSAHPLAIRPHPLAIRPRAYRPSLRASTFREHSALDLIPRPRRPSPPRRGLSVTSHTPSTRPPYATVFGSGLAGGCLGGLVGLGGGAIMVPMMTAFAGFTQHAAVGTSSAAVASTGLAGCFSFASSGKVDFMAAGAIASTAMVGARFGARFTSRFNQTQLQRTFAVFQLVVAPLVPIKGYLVRQSKVEGHTLQSTADPPQLSAVQMAKLAAIGLCSGVASGMFGIGGGVVITPALCLLTDMQHATVLGTTLTSMAPPGVVSAVTHHRMGNVTVSAVLPLCVGSACGALLGGQLAVHSPSEEPLQLIFALVIAAMGGHKLWALRGKV